ncbi:unnamed protein product [Urochloa decumbens]|uniref:Uncharacterized protein n=1 Tax=Urochloa decumbens TaxID=240449 RepID=A0ABC9BUX0_9POAL
MSRSNKRKKAHKSREKTRNLLDDVFEEEFGISSSQGALSELNQELVSYLSETVVSLASFNGGRFHVICTGIVVKNDKFGTSILTSASLVRSFDIDNGCKIIPGLMIKVGLPNKQSAMGWLMHYDLNYNVAVVNTSHYPGFRAAHFDHHMQFEPDSKVVALGRCFNTGKLMALSGIVTDEPGVYRKHLMVSTCDITMVMTGGPLVDLDGNFVGMNFCCKKRTPILPPPPPPRTRTRTRTRTTTTTTPPFLPPPPTRTRIRTTGTTTTTTTTTPFLPPPPTRTRIRITTTTTTGTTTTTITTTPFLPRDKIYNCLVQSGILWVEIEHGGDSTIERSTCEIQECSTPFMPNVEDSSSGERDKNQKRSISSTSSSEDISNGERDKNQKRSISSTSSSEEFVEEDLWHFLNPNPLPVDDFTEFVRNDLKSRNYPMPIRLEGGMRLINNFEEEFVEDTWSKLSKKIASDISRSVVSLASFKGEERFFACTGIFIDFNGSASRILTSASLVRTSADEHKIADNLKIQVYLPNKQLAVGTLRHYSVSYNIAVVSVEGYRCCRTAEFHKMQIEPHMEVVAIGRIFETGKLMATSGIVAEKESNLDCKELKISTCKVTKAGIGGPLIDVGGNFVGMNFYGMEETHYLPGPRVLECLRLFERSDVDEASYKETNRWPVPEPRWFYPSAVQQPWQSVVRVHD